MTKKHLIAVAIGLMCMSACAPHYVSMSGSLAASPAPPVQGRGYAVVSMQPGRNTAHKTIIAIRVARMDAMRSLAEQIHGLQVNGRTTIADAVVQSDTLRAAVLGVIRGARTILIEPQSSDIYEVVLEVDRAVIAQLLRLAGHKEQVATQDAAQEREREDNNDPNVSGDDNPAAVIDDNPAAVIDTDHSGTSTPPNFCGC